MRVREKDSRCKLAVGFSPMKVSVSERRSGEREVVGSCLLNSAVCEITEAVRHEREISIVGR